MKHLKTFSLHSLFESNEPLSISFAEDLRDFCETSLAYLIDEGMEIQVTKSQENYGKVVIYINEPSTIATPKNWDNIKDHMIPFFTRLKNRYIIREFSFKKSFTSTKKPDIYIFSNSLSQFKFGNPELEHEIKDLIDDSIDFGDNQITALRFYVDGYKQPKKSFLTKIKSFFK